MARRSTRRYAWGMDRAQPPPPGEADFPGALLPLFLSPALVIWMERVGRNVDRIIRSLGGRPERWRPHLKTTKIPDVWRVLLDAGVRHFKCATTREASLLLELGEGNIASGEVDLLVAYPLVGPALRRVAQLAADHPRSRLSILVEDAAGIADAPPSVGLFVDVNPGMDRTGVPARRAEAIEGLARLCGDRFRGLHFYDGHLGHLPFDERREATFDAYDRLMGLVERLRRAGLPPGEVITSGTPSYPCALAYTPFQELGDCVHRVSPGTVVYWDGRSREQLPDSDLEPAALLMARVVSHPDERLVTCDAGSKSLAAEVGDPCASVLGRPELVARAPSEEHLPLEVRSGEPPARGEILWLLPRHICPTVNLAERALLVLPGGIVHPVKVAARGHELGDDLWRSPARGG